MSMSPQASWLAARPPRARPARRAARRRRRRVARSRRTTTYSTRRTTHGATAGWRRRRPWREHRPSARLVTGKAPAAPTRPGAPPEPLRSLTARRTVEGASASPPLGTNRCTGPAPSPSRRAAFPPPHRNHNVRSSPPTSSRLLQALLDQGGASSADIAFYFTHWLTDLAGAVPAPLSGCQQFVARFPRPVRAALVPFLLGAAYP